ncbi:TIGR03756 family integrating conjugative element protein [Gallibacterium anatis]|uniref:Integrating conjugative element protein n=2 Tax=Gallibacterium anatis TaxID=750 RepID=U1H022_9PAST|nr:TIGR03756 family integrating conjugative element protein [Gallibacterium anatis]ERF77781.1 integrating conjugative element protein [Gallibacterium anatis 12656/12]KGQ47009.1 conjugal transfer protein [Gallibacterium anatis]HJF73568.1 TIGR03756 family integrating conjugative element protein [Gallibacterium anatis]
MKLIKVAVISLLSGSVSTAFALNTAQIMASSASPSCIEYRVVGICYWLYCSWSGCRVRTSVKVRHYLPEQVVSSYNNDGQNPWTEVKLLGQGINAGPENERPQTKQYSQLTFKNVDVIGHPGGAITQLLSRTGYYCNTQTSPFKPHFLSGLDVVGWRIGMPESLYPEAITPGLREIGNLGDMWGNIYPRAGTVTQIHPYKAAAVTAQRAADIISRSGQLHIYIPAAQKARPSRGYWPPPPIEEGKIKTHKWQMLYPKMENSCAIFPDRSSSDTYSDKISEKQDYAWALWRPYSCCKRRGQTFLFSTDWN